MIVLSFFISLLTLIFSLRLWYSRAENHTQRCCAEGVFDTQGIYCEGGGTHCWPGQWFASWQRGETHLILQSHVTHTGYNLPFHIYKMHSELVSLCASCVNLTCLSILTFKLCYFYALGSLCSHSQHLCSCAQQVYVFLLWSLSGKQKCMEILWCIFGISIHKMLNARLSSGGRTEFFLLHIIFEDSADNADLSSRAFILPWIITTFPHLYPQLCLLPFVCMPLCQ